uniref:Small-subunit processome Utp21 domain-containing protein n=1 Tax=Romanomermis culicivorax TaxID=13658 RepID=A0A915HDN8_ROMCU
MLVLCIIAIHLGMRICKSAQDFDSQLESARREALKSFANDDMIVEKFVENPRHVEVQVFGDCHNNYVYLFERDCSVQRRHQKIIEEAPAPNISDKTRHSLGQTACRAAAAVGYVGAGTVEFIMDADQKFFFMEMNTRLQVEHPVTEMITGFDLVEWQLRVASGECLPVSNQDRIELKGHSFEARIYAEDPENNFVPGSGFVPYLSLDANLAKDPHVRVETGIEEGDQVSVHYDPMIAKLVAWSPDGRRMALAKLRSVLAGYKLIGLKTNVSFLDRLAKHREFEKGNVYTDFIRDYADDLFSKKSTCSSSKEIVSQAVLASILLERNFSGYERSDDPFNIYDHFHNNLTASSIYQLKQNDIKHKAEVRFVNKNQFIIEVDGFKFDVKLISVKFNSDANRCHMKVSAEINSQLSTINLVAFDDTFTIFDKKSCDLYEFETVRPNFVDKLKKLSGLGALNDCLAPMPGVIEKVLVKPGSTVSANDPLIVMVAMKMEYVIKSPGGRTVDKILCKVGDNVPRNAHLVTMAARESILFASYKALGLVSGNVPAAVVYVTNAKLHAIVLAVGNVIHTYRSRKLALWGVSAPLPSDINCIAATERYIFAACGSKIYALYFGRNVARTYSASLSNFTPDEESDRVTESDIKFMLVLGDHLMSVDGKSHLHVFDIQSGDVLNSTNFDTTSFEISALCHPATYLNKVLLGSRQGPLKLFNVKTNKMIYEFKGKSLQEIIYVVKSWHSPISCLEQSPAVDVVMVGLSDGRICVHNLKVDETLMTFKQDWGAVSAISCRTDGPPLMISACHDGHLAVWDLEKRKLKAQMRSVHNGHVHTLITLLNEPLLVTSGEDNSIKMWIFDRADGQARLLHLRDGHKLPPNFIRFNNPDGSYILSAGLDGTVKAFHTRKDHLHKNLGSAGTMRKQVAQKKSLDWERIRLPPCIYISSNICREEGWDNVACCHKDHPLVTTWTSRRNRLGDHHLCHGRFTKNSYLAKKLIASKCYVTSCGNFVAIGYSTGHVDVFNIQSGIYRGTFVDPEANLYALVSTNNKNNFSVSDRAHAVNITGICGDYLNSFTVTSCSQGFLKFWHFKTKKLRKSLKLEYNINGMILHQDNNFIAVSFENHSFAIVDPEFHRITRFFDRVHSASIIDMTFNNSGHWLLTASLDKTVKIWDLVSSSLIDVIALERPCLSLTFSPTGEYLATVHDGLLGVYLWALKSMYAKISVRALPLDFKPKNITQLPKMLDDRRSVECMEIDDVGEKMNAYISPTQLSENLLTYSSLSTPRWAFLIDWETIKERNKPKEPPQKPKQAPFFLPTTTELNPKFKIDDAAMEQEIDKTKSVIKVGHLDTESNFGRQLSVAASEEDFSQVFEILKSQNPSSIETELRILSPFYGGSIKHCRQFLFMILAKFSSFKDFELVSSYLSLFVKLHRDVLWTEDISNDASELENENLNDLLSLVAEKQKDEWNKLDELFSRNLCLLNYAKLSVI